MNDRKLREHFDEWHPEYLDNTNTPLHVVHEQDHATAGFTNHRHVLGFTIPITEGSK